jgi:large subunit ribosomal protein L21
LTVDRLDDHQEPSLTINQVLCIFDEEGKSVSVGAPYVEGAHVTADIISHQKGDKINVLKFHRKNRYERNKGFRPYQTTITITGIQSK